MKAIGLVFDIGVNRCKPEEVDTYLKDATCELAEEIGIDPDDNPLVAKYYDYNDGLIYFHFKEPVDRAVLEGWVKESEIILEEKN